MIDSYHDEAASYEAAEEARRVELAAISDSEGLAGYDGDWAEQDAADDAARNEAALVASAYDADAVDFCEDYADEDLPF